MLRKQYTLTRLEMWLSGPCPQRLSITLETYYDDKSRHTDTCLGAERLFSTLRIGPCDL